MAGVVTLSIEVELAWGQHDKGSEAYESVLSKDRVSETAALQSLLTMCDDFDVPISFDVVGHLFHDSCRGVHQSPHEPGWFDADPGTDVDTDPLFYAPDLVAAIDEATADHELCTHTYSHALCDEISSPTLTWELDQVSAVHESAGIGQPRSIVTPRHRPVDRSVLAEHGIDVLRRPFPEREPYDAQGIRSFIRQYVRSHPLRDAAVVEGVLETYCTAQPSLTAPFLRNGRRYPSREHRVVPRQIRQLAHERYLEKTLERTVDGDHEVHLWTHLYNMSNDAQWPPIRSFLASLAEYRDKGAIEIRTMRDLAVCHSID